VVLTYLKTTSDIFLNIFCFLNSGGSKLIADEEINIKFSATAGNLICEGAPIRNYTSVIFEDAKIEKIFEDIAILVFLGTCASGIASRSVVNQDTVQTAREQGDKAAKG